MEPPISAEGSVLLHKSDHGWHLPRDEEAWALIAFTFFNKPQDYDWFIEKWWGPQAQQEPPTVRGLIAKAAYGVTDIVESGVFLSEADLEQTLERLRSKKIYILLQDHPGVGKTFIARELAYAMMGEVDNSRIEMVQFRRSYSFDDFHTGIPSKFQPRKRGPSVCMMVSFSDFASAHLVIQENCLHLLNS